MFMKSFFCICYILFEAVLGAAFTSMCITSINTHDILKQGYVFLIYLQSVGEDGVSQVLVLVMM